MSKLSCVATFTLYITIYLSLYLFECLSSLYLPWESESARKQAYREYLREIKARVDQRPLLFEQESQANAKRTAQRKYEQLLKEAGLDEDILERLLTDDGKIVSIVSDFEREYSYKLSSYKKFLRILY